MGRPRVLLADDHELLQGAFEKLTPECEIVGQVAEGRELIDAAVELRPDVIVLDISMPHLTGLETGRRIKQALGNIKLIFVTMNEEAHLAAEAFRAGASAYLLKRSAPSELVTAVREVMQGRSYVTPLVTEGLVALLMHLDESPSSHALTSRQREVLQLLAEGNSMKEAAAVLKLTPRTVAFHKYQMMEQLQIKSTAELIRYAVTHHIV